uniref:Uncharacterized protein n=1 Tax=Aegilops tauschii subsp. strangulata TaxID=200361 RepID=A0A453KBF3_AEGTS
MSGREVREYTNLSDPKDRKSGKGKDKIDDEDVTFQRMCQQMQDVAGERGGYLHGRGALDSDDLLYLKEQMEAEEDAERRLRRTEKRAFAAFKQDSTLADSAPALPAALCVDARPKSDIRQRDLLKNIVGIKPKRPKVCSSPQAAENDGPKLNQEVSVSKMSSCQNEPKPAEATESRPQNVTGSLLGLAYESSDEE